MSLENILQAIIEQANTEKEKILKEAQAEVAQINAEYIKKYETKQKELLNIAQQKAKNKISQTKFNLNNKIKTEILKAQKQLLDEIFEQARKEFIAQKDIDKQNFWVKYINQIPKNSKGTIIIAKNDYDIIKKLMKDIKIKEIKSSDDISGGFIFKSNELDINYSLEVILDNIRNNIEVKIANFLFS